MTPTAADIERHVFQAFEDFGVDPAAINRNALLEDLEVDSLDLVELGQTLKKTYGIVVRPKDFTDVKTVSDALGVVETKFAEL